MAGLKGLLAAAGRTLKEAASDPETRRKAAGVAATLLRSVAEAGEADAADGSSDSTPPWLTALLGGTEWSKETLDEVLARLKEGRVTIPEVALNSAMTCLVEPPLTRLSVSLRAGGVHIDAELRKWAALRLEWAFDIVGVQIAPEMAVVSARPRGAPSVSGRSTGGHIVTAIARLFGLLKRDRLLRFAAAGSDGLLEHHDGILALDLNHNPDLRERLDFLAGVLEFVEVQNVSVENGSLLVSFGLRTDLEDQGAPPGRDHGQEAPERKP